MTRHLSSYFFSPRILRSHRSDCWGRELDTALEAYSDEWLRELAQTGFDAIWVRIDLREMVASRLFPKVPRQPLSQLNRLVARAARHGVRVFVYLNEPQDVRAEDPFWKKHPDLKGKPGSSGYPSSGGMAYRLCTSQPAVQAFLEESAAALFRKTPGLGGAFLINASERITHCYSHYYPKPTRTCAALRVDWKFHAPSDIIRKAEMLAAEEMTAWQRDINDARVGCPRCAQRHPVDVTAEVITLLARGIHAAAPRAPVIVWTWSWDRIEPDPQTELIRRLPKDVILMSDWECGGFKKILGRDYYVDEYSFSSIGPSPHFLSQLRLAHRRGLKVMAKMMVGATHEFAAVPYLPLFSLLAEKMIRMRKCGVSGYLGCWNFGGDLTPMSRLAGRLSWAPALSSDQALRWLARTEFRVRRHARLVAAWKHFGRGWQEYPFAMPFIYCGPMGYATAFPFTLRRNSRPMPVNWQPLPRDQKGRILAGFEGQKWIRLSDASRRFQQFGARQPAPFDAATVTGALEKLLAEWRRGLKCYRDVIGRNDSSDALMREFRLAQHIGLCLQSTVHIIQFYTGLDAIAKAHDRRTRECQRALLLRIAEVERENVIADRELVVQDDGLGYHPEAHARLFTVADLDDKLFKLERIIRALKSRLSR